MAAGGERLKILALIRDGKITPDEGVRLIAALQASSPPLSRSTLPPAPPAPPVIPAPTMPSPGQRQPRWLVVRITDMNSGKLRVNVRLPVGVITMGMKMGAKFSPEIEGLNAADLKAYIESGETGQMVDIYDENDGEHIEVFIE